jgi:parallel beta-helix repeat protein
VEDNTVNGKPLVYLKYLSDYKVEDAGQVILDNCNNITIENLDLSNTSVGIALWKTENSKISNNTVCNNKEGIYLYYSSKNTITGNNVSNNEVGIRLYHYNNNNIYPNNFINNTDNVYKPTPKPTPNLPPPVITRIDSWENPKVVIKNDAHLSITVSFTGPTSATIYLLPGATKTHQFSPGMYSISATATNVVPFRGSESLSRGYKYTWIFYISSVP